MDGKKVRTVCPFCAVGCHLDLKVENDRVLGLEWSLDSPVNEGNLCAKGIAAHRILNHEDRLTRPLRRQGNRWEAVSWEEAFGQAAGHLRSIVEKYGPEAVGFLASAKCTNEENYLIQKLARMLGSPHVDHCARLCHASTLAGLAPMFGTGAATNPLSDLAEARCLFFVGSNLAENHPVAFRWVRQAKDKGAFLIVADPRRTPTAWWADLYLPIRPGTDVVLLNAMLHVVFREGLFHGEFVARRTRGMSAVESAVLKTSPERAEEITGVPSADIVRAAKVFAQKEPAALVYCMGVTQHRQGTDGVRACANLVLATGNVGRVGAGLYPVRGQDNVQGACDMGALSDFLPGYRSVEDPVARSDFERIWGCEKGTLPASRGMSVTEMEDAAGSSLRALVVMGENPVVSSPNSDRVRAAFEQLDFLLVLDLFLTESAEYAHLLLPAAAWAEKSGSKTNADRRVQWSPRAIPPPGDARPDAWILARLARHLGMGRAFAYETPEQVLHEINRVVPAYAGITPERLKSSSQGIYWPCPEEDHPGTPRLFEERFSTSDGCAVFLPVFPQDLPEPTNRDYPYCLTTGRVTLHYNSGAMTRRIERIRDREPELFVEIHPEDAEREGIVDGTVVRITTRRGDMEAKAVVTPTIRQGVVFAPFHFPRVNQVTQDCMDPEARIPEYKTAACRLSLVSGEAP